MSEPQVKSRMESSSNILPPISALFQGGVQPSSVALQSLISEIDLQLDVNTRELDTCLQSILTACNRLPGSRTFSTPKDALGYMCSSHTLEKDTCYDPEADEAVAIIKALCDSLEKNPGSEESILQEILSLASEEGLILPLRCSSLAAISQSSSSLNMQLDTMDQLIEGKWGKLIHNIQKHLVSQLLNLPTAGQDRSYFWLLNERRMELIGGLRALASDDEAWITYRNVRGQQLEQLFNSLLPDNDSENVNYKEFCGNCDTVATRIIEMMEEDFIVLSSGQFKKIGGVLRILHDLYLEKYSDEMSLLVEEIADDIRDFNKKSLKASKSDHGINKIQAKPPHRGSYSGTPPSPPTSPGREGWASKMPSNSKSLDTMFLASTYKTEKDKLSSGQRVQRQSSMAVPKDCLTSLRLIALSLIKLEEFLESLGRMTSWDVTGLPIRKNKKKSNLRGVLKPCASPELRRHSLNLGSSFSSSDTQLDSSTAGERNVSSPQMDSIPAPKVIERNRSEDRVRWDWRMIFKKIASGLASAVEAKIEYAMSSALAKESAIWDEKHVFKTADFKLTQYGCYTDHPQMISKDVEEFITSIHELLPLARTGLEGCLIPVRTAFIDSLRIAVKNFHLHCVSLSKDIPAKGNLKQILIVISNSTYIKNYLNHVKTVLSADDNGKTFMSTLLKQFTELVDGLGKHLLQLHNQLISTVILNDAESSNWSNIKEFYEDERCSFSVQMWNFHLRAACHDMWQILPPRLAQTYFAAVLQDSLLLLMQRYSRVKPSFRRVKQMRYDITTILLCTSAFLLHASPTPAQVLDPGHNEVPQYSLHNQASNLLSCMVVVTSPIEILYRVFKRGFHHHFENLSPDSQTHTGNTQWLRWICRALFSSGTKHYDDMQTASALYLHLKLMLAQPVIERGLLIQALVMKDCTLPKLLLVRSCLQEDSTTSKLALALRSKTHPQASSESNSHTPASSSSSSSSPSKLVKAQKSQSSTDSSGSQVTGPSSPKMCVPGGELTPIQKVSDAVIHTMAHLQYFPDALVKCIIPTIERSACFEMFNVKNPLFSPDMEIPEWLLSLFVLMEPFIERTLEPMLRYVNKVKTSDNFTRPVISFVADLPCGCPPNYSLRDHPKPPTIKAVLIHCVELIVSEVEKSIIVLPVSILALFGALETTCYEQGIKTSHKCVALQIIAWALWRHLNRLHVAKSLPSELIKLQLKDHLPNLAENLFYVLTYGKSPNTPRFASKFIKSHKDWLQHKIQNISMFVSNDIHAMPDMDVTEMATHAFSEHLYSMIASNLMETSNGSSHLNVLSNLVINNGQWLKDQMDIQGPLASKAAKQKKQAFVLDISPPNHGSIPFDPMKEMNMIGDETFNQDAIMEFPLDWVAILTSDLGLSRAAFRSLLMNRSEMQEGAELEEAEKKPVDVLRAVYEHA